MDWLGEVSKSLVGTFVGAGLAFFLTRLHDANRRYQKNIAAGNLALFAIKSQYNEFLLFRKALYEDIALHHQNKNLPLCLSVKPSIQTYVGHMINFESLAFLFEKPGYGELFDDLHLSQTHYLDMIKFDEFRNTAITELHRELARHQNENPEGTIQDDMKAVGGYVVGAADSAVRGLALRARDDEESYLIAYSKLRTALHKELRVWWKCEDPTLINLVEAQPHFQKASLPPFPKVVEDAISGSIKSQP